MNSKNKILTAFVLISGVILLIGAGCGNKALTDVQKQPNTNPTAGGEQWPYDILPPAPDLDKNSTNLYDSAKEIAMPSALVSELKSIFSEACGAVKFTEEFLPSSIAGHMLIYVWKNEPTEEKLESAFIKYGYSIESPGSPIFVKKGNIELAVSWEEELYQQEIGVAITKEE